METYIEPLLVRQEISRFPQLFDGHTRGGRRFDMFVTRNKVEYSSSKFYHPKSEFISKCFSLTMENLKR